MARDVAKKHFKMFFIPATRFGLPSWTAGLATRARVDVTNITSIAENCGGILERECRAIAVFQVFSPDGEDGASIVADAILDLRRGQSDRRLDVAQRAQVEGQHHGLVASVDRRIAVIVRNRVRDS